MLDDTGLKCRSTHNNGPSFTPDGLKKAIELNQILGSKYIIMASAPRADHIDAWKTFGRSADRDFRAAEAARHGDRVSQPPGRMASGRRQAADGRPRGEHAEGRRPAVRRRHLPRGRRRSDRVDQGESRAGSRACTARTGRRATATTWRSARATRRGRRSSTRSKRRAASSTTSIEQETGATSGGELPMVQHCLDNWKKLRR